MSTLNELPTTPTTNSINFRWATIFNFRSRKRDKNSVVDLECNAGLWMIWREGEGMNENAIKQITRKQVH